MTEDLSLEMAEWVAAKEARWLAEEPARKALQLAAKRSREYPSISDQLDMLWHAMDQGILQKVPEFYEAIKKVKDKYPKGE